MTNRATSQGTPGGPMVFDLTRQPWLPVLDRAGRGGLIGLRELFTTAHELTGLDLAVPPGESVLLRILAAITYRITGLDDPRTTADHWQDDRGAVLAAHRFDAARIEEYFDTWAARFDLYATDRPWMQDPRLRTESKPSGTSKLVWGRASGNSVVWGQHHTDGTGAGVPVDVAILHMLTHLGYGAGGMLDSRTHEEFTNKFGKAAPYRGTISYHPLGTSLLQTLVLGLAHPGRYGSGHARAHGPDVDPCAWECAHLPDPATSPGAPTGICDVLTRRHLHAVLLVPDPHNPRSILDAHVTWGRTGDPVAATDPYLSYKTDGSATIRAADVRRQVWRDLDALLAGKGGSRKDQWGRPDVLSDLTGLPRTAMAGVRVTGYAFDQERGKTIDHAWFAATTPPILHYLADVDPAAYELVSALVAAAEAASRGLWGALRRAWDEAAAPVAGRDRKAGPGPWSVRAEPVFWASAYDAFTTALDTPPTSGDGPGIDPGKVMRGVALRVYDEVTASVTAPSAVRAVEMNRSHLL